MVQNIRYAICMIPAQISFRTPSWRRKLKCPYTRYATLDLRVSMIWSRLDVRVSELLLKSVTEVSGLCSTKLQPLKKFEGGQGHSKGNLFTTRYPGSLVRGYNCICCLRSFAGCSLPSAAAWPFASAPASPLPSVARMALAGFFATLPIINRNQKCGPTQSMVGDV